MIPAHRFPAHYLKGPPSRAFTRGRWKAAHPHTYHRLGLPLIGKLLGHTQLARATKNQRAGE
jgi:hypothetical protein